MTAPSFYDIISIKGGLNMSDNQIEVEIRVLDDDGNEDRMCK